MRWFSEADLRELAGDQSFARGERYVEHVANVARVKGGIVASVHGSEPEPYSVRLSYEGGTLSGTCDCPFGRSGAFCKHCVAAGLVVMARNAGGFDPEVGDGHVRAYLSGLDREALVGLVWDQAGKDDALYHRLSLRAARERGAPADLARLGGEVDGALRGHGFIDYQGSFEYAARAGAVVADLEDLVREGRASHAVPLLQQAVELIASAIEDMDDSSGSVGDVLTDAVTLHADACRQAPPNPDALARWLFELQANGPGRPGLAIGEYAAALGDGGLATYRALVRDAWEGLPARRGKGSPGLVDADADHRRQVITSMMEDVARLDGDTDTLVHVLARNLDSGWQYLRIATVLSEAGRDAEALDWAERGVEATADRPDPRLIDFTAEALRRAGRPDGVLDLRREAFRREPSLETYRALQAAAEPAGRWLRERTAALELLQSEERSPRAQTYQSATDGLPITHGRNAALVDVLLQEGDVEAAWSAAHAAGCMPATWRTLVQRRSSTHPAETIPIYQRFVDEAIDHRNLDGYRRAATLLEQLRDQFDRTGDHAAFQSYLDHLKAEHSRKRNLLAELRTRGL